MAKRGKTPSLITGSSGKPVKVVCQRQRKCTRCSNLIGGGSKCFEIPKVGDGFSTRKTFCIVCFQEVLAQTRKDLEGLELLIDE